MDTISADLQAFTKAVDCCRQQLARQFPADWREDRFEVENRRQFTMLWWQATNGSKSFSVCFDSQQLRAAGELIETLVTERIASFAHSA